MINLFTGGMGKYGEKRITSDDMEGDRGGI